MLETFFSSLSLKILEAAGKLSKGEGGCEKRKKKRLKDEQKKLINEIKWLRNDRKGQKRLKDKVKKTEKLTDKAESVGKRG